MESNSVLFWIFTIFLILSYSGKYYKQLCSTKKLWLFLAAGKHERNLLKKLFRDQPYDPLERPVEDESESLSVVVGLALSVIN